MVISATTLGGSTNEMVRGYGSDGQVMFEVPKHLAKYFPTAEVYRPVYAIRPTVASRTVFLNSFIMKKPEDRTTIRFYRYMDKRAYSSRWRNKFLQFVTGSPMLAPDDKITVSIGGVGRIEQNQLCSRRSEDIRCESHLFIPHFSSYNEGKF